MINHIKSAVALFIISSFIAFVLFWIILWAAENHKERARLDYIHQYREVGAMMELCSYGHDEVCFEVRKCPVCEKQNEVDRLQEETEKLRDEVKDLEERL